VPLQAHVHDDVPVVLVVVGRVEHKHGAACGFGAPAGTGCADNCGKCGVARRTVDPVAEGEGVREALLDVAEGADIVMVKPAMAYLDVVSAVRAAVDVPVAAYNISGEYSMVEAAAANGWIDRDASIVEVLTSIRRAGADIVLTYWALDAARLFTR